MNAGSLQLTGRLDENRAIVGVHNVWALAAICFLGKRPLVLAVVSGFNICFPGLVS